MRISLIALTLWAFSSGLISASALAEQTGELFLSDPLRAELQVTDDPTIVRSRGVRLQQNEVDKVTAALATEVSFNLFDDVSLKGTVENIEYLSSDMTVWSGTVSGDPDSPFTMVVTDELMVGNVRVMDGGWYQVRYQSDGLHVIHEIDPDQFLPCGVSEDQHIHLEETSAQLRDGSLRTDDGTRFDVMVVYTTSARLSAGSTAAMVALVNLAVTETNSAYASSGITPRLNLVHTAEVTYTETGSLSTDLGRLRGKTDGYIDNVHALRDTYSADLVCMIVQSGDACGIASLMSTLTPSFEQYAFCVVKKSCATGYYSFGHELGHNMGCHHDRANASGSGLYSYSYGYQQLAVPYRTIMAYDCSSGCTRVQRFSNPDVSYWGYPTGVAAGQSDSAYNALSINNAAYTVSNFRLSGDCDGNGQVDIDEIAANPDLDCQSDGILDVCQLDDNDCNNNYVPDDCDIAYQTSEDCNQSGVPDECELVGNDCNYNNIPDDCELADLIGEDGHPADADICSNGSATFTVTTEVLYPTYQWYKDTAGDPLVNQVDRISGANQAELHIYNVQDEDEGLYWCEITDGCLVIDSDAAELAIVVDPVITEANGGTSMCEHGSTLFTISHRGSGTFQYDYLWRKDGVPLDSQPNSRLLSISDASIDDDGVYTCQVSNSQCGFSRESEGMTFNVIGARFIEQPAPQCRASDEAAVFNMAVEYKNPISGFRWQRWYGDPYNLWVDAIAPQAGDVQPLQLAAPLTAGLYRGAVYLDNACWSYSNEVSLLINEGTADLDGDGDVDLADMAVFTECFQVDSSSSADCGCANLDWSNRVINQADWADFEAEIVGPQ